MNENVLTESDFNLTSKNNTNAQNNFKYNNMLETDTMSKLIVAEEFPQFDENYEKEGGYRETDANLSVEQEEIFWMNYSIKDLNEKIRKAKK